MKLSSPYNRFLHGVIYKDVKAIKRPLYVFDGQFVFRPSGLSVESLKQLLKHLDLDYPREDEKVLSITKLSTKQMGNHIEFMINLLADNGLTFKHIDEEWERIMESVRI